MFFFFFDLSEGMENCKKNQGKVREFQGGWQVTTLEILMIEILGYLCLFYCTRGYQKVLSLRHFPHSDSTMLHT